MNESRSVPLISPRDKAAFGRKVVEWSLIDSHLRPKTVGEITAQLSKVGVIVRFPSNRFQSGAPVRFVETSLEEWVIRLPPLALLNDTLNRIRSGEGYPLEELPAYFGAYPVNNGRYDENFLFVRVADFSVTQCG